MIGLDGGKIGKPADLADAARILRSLAGKTHIIYTAVAIVDDNGPGPTTLEKVSVEMRATRSERSNNIFLAANPLTRRAPDSIQGDGSRLIKIDPRRLSRRRRHAFKAYRRVFESRGISFHRDVEKLYREKSFMNWSWFA